MTALQDHPIAQRGPVTGRAATLALNEHPARRVVWLDALRILAILAVITIHTVSPLTAGAVVATFSPTWWVASTMNVASLWCVPVFVMISGGLLLRPSKPQPAAVFYKRRLHRIAIPTLFWTAVYLALRPTFLGEHLSRAQAAHDLATGHPYLQLYYLYVIAGLYAVTPVLRSALAHTSDRRLRQLAVGVLGFNVADYTLSTFFGAGGVNVLTEWLPFLGYFLAGAWLVRSVTTPTTVRRASALAAAAVLATIVLTVLSIHHFGWTREGRYFLGYQSPTVAVMATALFLAVRARAESGGWRPRRWVARISDATFGVFLLHPLLLVPLLQHLGRPAHLATVALGVPALVVSVAAVCTGVTLLLVRVPLVRRLVS